MSKWMYENRVVVAAILFGLSAIAGPLLVAFAGYNFAKGHPVSGMIDLILGLWNIWNMNMKDLYQTIKNQ